MGTTSVIFKKQKDYLIAGIRHDYKVDWQADYCRKMVKERYDIAHKNYMESMLVALPGGMGQLHISDSE